MACAIDGFALSVDRAALLDYRLFALPSTDGAARLKDDVQTIRPTTDSVALSIDSATRYRLSALRCRRQQPR